MRPYLSLALVFLLITACSSGSSATPMDTSPAEATATPTDSVTDVAPPVPQGDTYPQQATAVFQAAFASQGITAPLEELDWEAELARLKQAEVGLHQARALLATLSPPTPCEAFHEIMPAVLDQQEQIIKSAIAIANKVADGDVQGAYDISSTLDVGFDLVMEMSDHWTACYTAVHPDLS